MLVSDALTEPLNRLRYKCLAPAADDDDMAFLSC